MSKNLQRENRLQAVALMAIYHEGKSANDLLNFLGKEDREVCLEKLSEIIKSTPSKLREKAWLKIGALVASESFSGISEIHPAWVYEVLKNESPRIMGIVMRYLPSKHVRYILNRLPADVKMNIPSLLDSFAVSKPVLDVIKNNFESNFLPMKISRTRERFGFEHIYYLKEEEFYNLFMELGILEVAMALTGVSEKLLNVLLNRLNLKDAKRLHLRMKELGEVSKEIRQQARYAILELGDEITDPEQMLLEVGFSSFAKSMSTEDRETYELIHQKLSPHDAYKLRRLVDEYSIGITPSLVEERKKLVLTCIATLASEQKVESTWTRFSPTV